MGAYVKLLEYDNIDGMILLSELSRRRIRSIQKLIRVGRNEVVVVLRVDKEKGIVTNYTFTPCTLYAMKRMIMVQFYEMEKSSNTGVFFVENRIH